jgi:hypothetical protein
MFRLIFGPGLPWVSTRHSSDSPMQLVAPWRVFVNRSATSTDIPAYYVSRASHHQQRSKTRRVRGGDARTSHHCLLTLGRRRRIACTIVLVTGESKDTYPSLPTARTSDHLSEVA